MGFIGYLLAAGVGLLAGYLLGVRKNRGDDGDDEWGTAIERLSHPASLPEKGSDSNTPEGTEVVSKQEFARLQADHEELKAEADAVVSQRDERIVELEAELAQAKQKAEQAAAASKRTQQAKQKDRMSSVRRRMVTQRPGAGTTSPASKEEASLQQRYERAQKYLVTARKERDAARREVEELTSKLAALNTPPNASADKAPPAAKPRVPKRKPAPAEPSKPAAPAVSEEPSSSNGRPGWLLSAPVGDDDDLKKIKGVGPVMSKTLNELGVWHYRQLALLSSEDIDWLAEQVNLRRGRIDKADWVGQAGKLHEEKYGSPPE